MSEHPIESLMMTTMSSIQNMVDVNTIIGEPIETQNGITLIPISKVCFGFAAGGSEFNTNKIGKFSENTKLPFGGGSGAGVSISPVAFLVVSNGDVKLLQMSVDAKLPNAIVNLVPEVFDKVQGLLDKGKKEE